MTVLSLTMPRLHKQKTTVINVRRFWLEKKIMEGKRKKGKDGEEGDRKTDGKEKARRKKDRQEKACFKGKKVRFLWHMQHLQMLKLASGN